MSKESLSVGGQAVIEGVMMRHIDKVATAVRVEGKIKVKVDPYVSLTTRYSILGKPFIRGVISLFEMLFIGTRSLMWSANEQGTDDEKLTTGQIALTMIVALAFSLGLFVVLPYIMTDLIGLNEGAMPVIFNFVDGIIKMTILVGYIWIIGFMPDMRRVFQYHGAEHMAVHTHEHKLKLTIKNARRYPTAHKRCGTSFLMVVILTGVIIFSIVPAIISAFWPQVYTLQWIFRYLILIPVRILVMPLIAGIAYEWLKFSPKLSENSFLQILNKPGIWVQRLTTKQPDDDQLKVAFAALKAVIK